MSGGRFISSARSGFNAIELMVGTVIIMIVGVSLYAGITFGFSVTGSTRDRIRATQIMVERVEALRLYNWNQLVSQNMMPLAFTNYYFPLASGDESKGTVFTGTIVVTNAVLNPPATYSDKMRSIIVNISWVTGKITNQSSLTTYVSRDGLQNYVYTR